MMELLILICLLVVIGLLLQDRIVIQRHAANKEERNVANPELPEIMGQPKPDERHRVPKEDSEGHVGEPEEEQDTFEPETGEDGFEFEIPQEELDEVFGELPEWPDWDEEEEELAGYGQPNSDDGFATGVTFEELTTVGNLLQQDVLEPSFEEQAVDIVQRIQGTELFALLEESIEDASAKIARLLDRRVSEAGDPSGSSTLRNDDDFDIREFV